MDFVHGVSTSGVKSMMEVQMEKYVRNMTREGGYLTWEETLPGTRRREFGYHVSGKNRYHNCKNKEDNCTQN